jgi:hypothetical protein
LRIPRPTSKYPSRITFSQANAPLTSLRAIVRQLVATNPPALTKQLHSLVRARLLQKPYSLPKPDELFIATSPSSSSRPTPSSSPSPYDNPLAIDDSDSDSHSEPDPTPTAAYKPLLAHARVTFGSGLGFASLLLYLPILQATLPLRWEEDGPMMETLAIMDGDMAQAIQACKEEIQRDDSVVGEEERTALRDFKDALREVKRVCELWNGEFPFDRACVCRPFFLSQSAF